MAYTKYSLTPANNTATPPDGAPEGMLPSAVNDTMRDMMAQIRDVGDGIRDGTYTMTAPKITGGTITGSTINNSAIGGTTAAAGAFTTLSATGVTTVQAGTVSLPAITTTGDTNTGIFFPAADTIAFTEGGVEAMRIDSSGRVGIGTTSPSAKLNVIGGNIRLDNNQGLEWAGSNNYIYGNETTDFIVIATNGNEAMRIDSSGNVLVGASTVGMVNGGIQSQPNGNTTNVPFFGCAGNSSNSAYICYALYSTSLSQYQFYVDYSGVISARSATITNLSDAREKTNIKDLETGLAEVLQLKPKRYDWKDNSNTNMVGFIAQEVLEVLPDLVGNYRVKEGQEPRLSLRTGDILPTLVKAIQELNAKVEAQAAEIALLKSN